MIRWISLFPLLLAAAIAAAEPPAPLPKDHPIYQVPRLEDMEIRGEIVKRLPIVQTTEEPPQGDPAKNLRWSLTLAKTKYYVGEVIWGRLTVENSEARVAYRLSPPYHGNHVSTIGVWASHQELKSDSPAENWTALQECCWLNKGDYHEDLAFRGRPMKIAPGAKHEAWLPINVAQVQIAERIIKGGSYPRCSWLPGVGFSTPGNYRFYLRYVNLEKLATWPYARFFISGKDGKQRAKTEPRVVTEDIDSKAIVLGPFEIEIVPLPRKNDAALEEKHDFMKMIQDWQRCARSPVTDSLTNQTHEAAAYIPLAFRSQFVDRKYDSLRWPMEFMFLRQFDYLPYAAFGLPKSANNESEAPEGDAKESASLQNLAAVLANLDSGDPLREHVEFMRCWVLHDLGREKEAVELARQLGTPDALVLLDEMEVVQGRKHFCSSYWGLPGRYRRFTWSRDPFNFNREEVLHKQIMW